MSIYTFLFFALLFGGVFFLAKSYNAMRRLAETVKEGFSNISVVTRKKTALVNQLIAVVNNYAESEKFVMLKLSDDNVQAVQSANASTGVMLAEIGRMAQRFPDLKSNQQYHRLMDSINGCERDVEQSRLSYNDRVRQYNTACTSLPAVLYAQTLGFGHAEYLTIEAQELDAGMQKAVITEDSERLNALLGSAGKRAIAAARRVQDQGRDWAARNSGTVESSSEPLPDDTTHND